MRIYINLLRSHSRILIAGVEHLVKTCPVQADESELVELIIMLDKQASLRI